ncbi:unnamed protein product [Amoebophrya sp. A120]|nr:unnamed protein product [Amoebophrya sp. A120]|eukprot:GSA120T00020295001.1
MGGRESYANQVVSRRRSVPAAFVTADAAASQMRMISGLAAVLFRLIFLELPSLSESRVQLFKLQPTITGRPSRIPPAPLRSRGSDSTSSASATTSGTTVTESVAEQVEDDEPVLARSRTRRRSGPAAETDNYAITEDVDNAGRVIRSVNFARPSDGIGLDDALSSPENGFDGTGAATRRRGGTVSGSAEPAEENRGARSSQLGAARSGRRNNAARRAQVRSGTDATSGANASAGANGTRAGVAAKDGPDARTEEHAACSLPAVDEFLVRSLKTQRERRQEAQDRNCGFLPIRSVADHERLAKRLEDCPHLADQLPKLCSPQPHTGKELYNCLLMNHVPSELSCPISLQLLTKPVQIPADGTKFHFEQDCLEKWFAKERSKPAREEGQPVRLTHPLTRQELYGPGPHMQPACAAFRKQLKDFDNLCKQVSREHCYETYERRKYLGSATTCGSGCGTSTGSSLEMLASRCGGGPSMSKSQRRRASRRQRDRQERESRGGVAVDDHEDEAQLEAALDAELPARAKAAATENTIQPISGRTAPGTLLDDPRSTSASPASPRLAASRPRSARTTSITGSSDHPENVQRIHDEDEIHSVQSHSVPEEDATPMALGRSRSSDRAASPGRLLHELHRGSGGTANASGATTFAVYDGSSFEIPYDDQNADAPDGGIEEATGRTESSGGLTTRSSTASSYSNYHLPASASSSTIATLTSSPLLRSTSKRSSPDSPVISPLVLDGDITSLSDDDGEEEDDEDGSSQIDTSRVLDERTSCTDQEIECLSLLLGSLDLQAECNHRHVEEVLEQTQARNNYLASLSKQQRTTLARTRTNDPTGLALEFYVKTKTAPKEVFEKSDASSDTEDANRCCWFSPLKRILRNLPAVPRGLRTPAAFFRSPRRSRSSTGRASASTEAARRASSRLGFSREGHPESSGGRFSSGPTTSTTYAGDGGNGASHILSAPGGAGNFSASASSTSTPAQMAGAPLTASPRRVSSYAL